VSIEGLQERVAELESAFRQVQKSVVANVKKTRGKARRQAKKLTRQVKAATPL
jgi:hypothetical protein